MSYRTFIRDGGAPVDCHYAAKGGCPSNGWDEPGEAPEVELYEAADPVSGELVELTEAERQRFEEEVCADPATYDDDSFFDDMAGDL